jgi:hypothetical protein
MFAGGDVHINKGYSTKIIFSITENYCNGRSDYESMHKITPSVLQGD